jgi:hypothetical protein
VGWWIWDSQDQVLQQVVVNNTPFVQKQPKIVELVPPHPWLTVPTLDQQLSSWEVASAKIPLSIAGWRAGVATYTTHAITLPYMRNGQLPVDQFRAAASMIPGITFTTSPNGRQGQVVIPISVPKFKNGEIPLLPADRAVLKITSYFQAIGMGPVNVRKVSPTLPPLPPSRPGEQNVWKTPDWQEYAWSFISPIAPRALLRADVLPELRINSMKADFSAGSPSWALSGVYYAKN